MNREWLRMSLISHEPKKKMECRLKVNSEKTKRPFEEKKHYLIILLCKQTEIFPKLLPETCHIEWNFLEILENFNF